jgi:predicted nucleic-acid-binding Zn-ribbon protein
MSNGEGGVGDYRQAAQAWLAQRQQSPEASYCPFCRGTNWMVGELVGTPNLAPGGFDPNAPVLPAFPLICTGCGYTMLFNAVVAGLVKPGPPGSPPRSGPYELPQA